MSRGAQVARVVGGCAFFALLLGMPYLALAYVVAGVIGWNIPVQPNGRVA